MITEYMEDCIHLKACRRLCKIAKYRAGRGCTENCTAYESKDNYYTWEQVESVKYGACEAGKNGYDGGDLLITDFI